MRAPSPPRSSLARAARALLVAALALVALASASVALHLGRTALREGQSPDVAPRGTLDDASRLESTRVSIVVDVPPDPEEAVRVILGAIALARSKGMPLSVAGARHSMGGQTLARDGVVLDMLRLDGMSLDPSGRILHVGSGARWEQVLASFRNAFYETYGRSVDGGVTPTK